MAEFKDGAGYHFAINVDGEVIQGRRLDAVGHFDDKYDWDSVIVRWVGTSYTPPRQASAIERVLINIRGIFGDVPVVKL